MYNLNLSGYTYTVYVNGECLGVITSSPGVGLVLWQSKKSSVKKAVDPSASWHVSCKMGFTVYEDF